MYCLYVYCVYVATCNHIKKKKTSYYYYFFIQLFNFHLHFECLLFFYKFELLFSDVVIHFIDDTINTKLKITIQIMTILPQATSIRNIYSISFIRAWFYVVEKESRLPTDG